MEFLERVLHERAGHFAEALTEVGFSDAEARRFVVEAGPALVQSCEWEAMDKGPAALAHPDAARDVLAGIRGHTLASSIGLSPEKTWAGLREFVPAVLEASDVGSFVAAAGSERDRGDTPGGGDAAGRFDVGFGLTLERIARRDEGGAPKGGRERPIGVTHPIFGRLLSLQE